jgi:hypothetical protein
MQEWQQLLPLSGLYVRGQPVINNYNESREQAEWSFQVILNNNIVSHPQRRIVMISTFTVMLIPLDGGASLSIKIEGNKTTYILT